MISKCFWNGGKIWMFLCSSSVSSPWQHSQSLNTSPHLILGIWFCHWTSDPMWETSMCTTHDNLLLPFDVHGSPLCNHSLYCFEKCALKNCLSWLCPRFRHYVSAELRFTTVLSGSLYWHPHSHGQSWFQDNKSLPRWFGFWKEMEQERAHMVGELSVDLIITWQPPSWMIRMGQVEPPFLSYVQIHFLYTQREKRLKSLQSGWFCFFLFIFL